MRELPSSERGYFCSGCHDNISGTSPAVLQKTEKALSSVNNLQIEISKARGAVISAKAEGKDVTEAERHLESATTILKHVPEAWHRFNLTYFENEVKQGIANARKAEKIEAEPEKTPRFGGILLISGLITAYFLKRH